MTDTNSETPRKLFFPATSWSLVKRATNGGQPLDTWIGFYWFPLYAWARHRGMKAEDAADSVQDFLLQICDRRLLGKTDPSRGKLRSWLLKSFSNHLINSHRREQRKKRGGGIPHLIIDWPNAEAAYLADHSHAMDLDTVYARAWAMTTIEEALDRLAAHYRQTGREPLFQVLLPSLEAPFPEKDHSDAAIRLGMTSQAIRQAAARFRQRYRRCLLDVAATRLGITCEARLHQELLDLLGGK
jgi:RNA polymerase sigma-70 factor (ECF subfamily)